MSASSDRVALWVEALSHRYPGAERLALDDVSLRVEPGERLGLLGPNGAGKSTLMRLCCGFLPVMERSGTRVELAGLDVRTRSRDARARVGYLPEHVPLYTELRAREHLSFRARIKGVPRRRRAAELDRVAERTGIGHVLDAPIGKLSRGYRQRVGVADALLGDPPVVILDEPTVGLDPNQVREIRAMLRALGGEHTLVFSSHLLAEVEMLCDRVVILSEGRVVADEALATATARGHVVVAWTAGVEATRPVLAAAWRALGLGAPPEGAVEAAEDGSRARVRVPDGASVGEVRAAVGQASLEAGVALVELRAGRTRLEERFAEVTGGGIGAGAGADASGQGRALRSGGSA
ncbi:ABC transporter ATP-binding protein [Paraliomyxa miuraensis]|uniref:ABC transporter ATP-binding protein n=1 Tax=Paraliomyxa miuraensis TaxID=376150 RepID=UPI00225025ED|nr:ABC transporter ATP-binding protein [Paraliomyxa miuraensis]MCX4244597.1 ABC transporter ATP-binding protein [Paraliomyxa miuraensis]